MKLAIIRIGNSRGLRLPKAVLEQCGFTDAVELTIETGRIVLTPITAPRAGWAEAFAAGAPIALSEEDRDWLDAPLDAEDD